jgi:hypothetical protein
VRSLVAVIGVLSTQIGVLQGQVEANIGRHPAVEIRAAGRQPPERVARSYPCHLVG